MEMCSTFSLCCTTTHDFYTLFWETKDGGKRDVNCGIWQCNDKV